MASLNLPAQIVNVSHSVPSLVPRKTLVNLEELTDKASSSAHDKAS